MKKRQLCLRVLQSGNVLLKLKVIFKQSKGQMNKLDLKLVENELEHLQTIVEKLDYWNNIFIENIVKPSTNREDQNIIREGLFGKTYQLKTWIEIPEKLYSKHYQPYESTPEFTYWFLIRNANMYFNSIIKVNRIDEKIETPIAKLFIESELKRINDFEQQAEQLLIDKKIDIYNHYNFKYADEIEYLRIKSNYYQTNTCNDVQSLGNKAVVRYATHVLVKNYLLDQLAKITSPPQQAEILNEHQETETKEQAVRRILKNSFINSGDAQFDSLIVHITAEKRPTYNPTLKIDGTKSDLYIALSKLIKLGYDRKHLASVFSELCDLDSELLYRKM